MMKRIDTADVLSAILIVLFMYTGVAKLADYAHFQRSIHLQHFPLWLSGFAVATLPAAEISVAALLIFEKSRFIGLIISLSMLLLFTGYIAAIIGHVSSHTPCPCGGAIATMTWPQHLCFNLLFLAINMAAIYLIKKKAGLNSR